MIDTILFSMLKTHLLLYCTVGTRHDSITQRHGKAHFFQYSPDDKLDVKKLLKIIKPQFAPVGNSKRQCQEIVMAKLIAFKAVEGKLTFCSCCRHRHRRQ